MSTATAEVDFTAKQIAEHCNVSPRTVNLWRAAAEHRLGYKLGSKIGKTWQFSS
jgi:FixJ family two-component response regulator